MSGRIGLLVSGSIAALAIAGVALAQNVPAQYVVSGKAAEQIQDFTTVNLATAEKLTEACEKEATTQGVQVSIYVLDNDGNHVYMDRMDGQGYIQIATAEMKARTALMGREASKNRMNRVVQDPNAEFEDIQLGYFPNSGGLPLLVNKQLIGVIGVGGSAPHPPMWSDEICAHRALIQIMGPTTAPLVEDLPPHRNAPPANPLPVPRFDVGAMPKTSLPADWVVGGKGAQAVLDGNQISLAAAKKIAKTCRDWAQARNSSMSLYILDTAGEFVHMERMDGQVFNNMRSALLKAQSALKTRQPTSIRAAQLSNDPSGLPRSVFWYQFYSESGGIPIVVDGQMIGSIGVGGVAGGGDEACAVEGLKAAFGDRVTLPVYPAVGAGRGRGAG